MTIKAVDLFCGVGGLTYGLQKAGIPVVAGIDIDDSCEYAYTHNNNCTFIHKSVEDVTGKEIRALLRGADVKILVGCAPCQPFSSHQKDKQNRSKHKDWKLLYQFGRLVEETRPHIVSMENVPELEKEKVFKDFVSTLEGLNYIVNYQVVNVANYGVPQRRKRLILLASRRKEIKLIDATHQKHLTVRDAIGSLPRISAGEANENDRLHISPALSPINNVYIIANKDDITVEDDGKGMSYADGDIQKYLNVAAVSRNTDAESLTPMKRKKMGRKGVGKLAALSVSENVLIKTISNGEKSGFVLSRHINDNNLLVPLTDEQISFERVSGNGTSVVMQNPQYKLHSTLKAIKRNLLKIFPLVNEKFKIHLIRGTEAETIENFDKEMISELSTLITLGDEFTYLNDFFQTPYGNEIAELRKNKPLATMPISMDDKSGVEHTYNVEIKGWIGTYTSTRGRKVELTDFPDNFISLYANQKMGEFNILPVVGQNKLNEVYVVGQLHVDIFELTELPDMALSNRQGYKTDDPRYQAVLDYVRKTLLPDILKMRDLFVSLGKKKKEEKKLEQQRQNEASFKKSVDTFRKNTAKKAAQKISSRLGISTEQADEVEAILSDEINTNSPDMGIKSIIDSQKKKLLISQTYRDKDLADIIYNMLVFNNVPPEDIIYTNCDDEVSRIPEGDVGKSGIYDYLRDFFVDSYSTQKIYVIFVTSHNTKSSWGALMEVGAAWITQVEHKIFNIYDFRPEHPLDDEQQWHSSSRDDDGNLYMSKLSVDIFAQKIEYICDKLGYKKRTRQENKDHLSTLVKVTPR